MNMMEQPLIYGEMAVNADLLENVKVEDSAIFAESVDTEGLNYVSVEMVKVEPCYSDNETGLFHLKKEEVTSQNSQIQQQVTMKVEPCSYSEPLALCDIKMEDPILQEGSPLLKTEHQAQDIDLYDGQNSAHLLRFKRTGSEKNNHFDDSPVAALDLFVDNPELILPSKENNIADIQNCFPQGHLVNTDNECLRFNFCNRSVGNHCVLQDQLSKDSGQEFPKSQAVVYKNSFAQHHLLHTDKKSKHDICKKIFTQRSSINRYHSGQKLFKCEICNNKFTRKNNLKAHQLIHSGQRSFKCDVCGSTFSRKGNLKTHQLCHTGQKLFKCDLCDKTFALKSHLMTHQLTHSGEKLFECDVCNKTFSQKNNLTRHKLVHTGQRLYKCDMCSKTFTQKGNLVTHEMHHTGQKMFKCDICNIMCTRKSHLKAHMLIHTGQRFKCDTCNKTFNWRRALKTHRLIHAGQKLFDCDMCNRSFTHKGSLNRHKLNCCNKG